MKRCVELADGVVAVITRDQPLAEQNLKLVVAGNATSDVKLVAQAIVLVGQIPGAGAYVAPLTDAARLLLKYAAEAPPQPQVAAPIASEQSPYAAQASEKPSASIIGYQERALADRVRYAIDRALAAPVDPAQLETHTFQVSQDGARCSIFGADAICARLLDGPFLLRDWIAMPGCPDQLLVGSSPVNEVLDAQLRVRPSWLVPATNTGAYGAHLFVPAGERLIVAVRPAGQKLSGDPRCAVTWAGFRPRMLPPRAPSPGDD
jgi:hypothetical protein